MDPALGRVRIAQLASTVMNAERMYHLALAGIWLTVAGGLLIQGWSYYTLPLAERPYLEAHALYTPAGEVGLPLGVIGTLMIVVGVAMYVARKRMKALRGLGKLRHWLSFHIFLCTLGPFLILLHSSFKVGGLVSISFWSMVIVVLSGIVGRYVYVRIPKTLHGQFHSLVQLEAEKAHLMTAIRAVSHLEEAAVDRLFPPLEKNPAHGFLRAFVRAMQYDVQARRNRKWIDEQVAALPIGADGRGELHDYVLRYTRTEQQRMLLVPFQRVFQYWHTFHIPLAVVMFLVMGVHIGVAIMFGYVWEF